MFTHAINTARQRIWIASPYFVRDLGLLNALQLAGLRRVDVRIMIPDMSDHYLVYLAAFSYLEDAGRFFRYTDGFLHQKVMLIDDSVATIGTANMDNRSRNASPGSCGRCQQATSAAIYAMIPGELRSNAETLQCRENSAKPNMREHLRCFEFWVQPC